MYLTDFVLQKASSSEELHNVQLKHVPLAPPPSLIRVVHQLRNPLPQVHVASLLTSVLGIVLKNNEYYVLQLEKSLISLWPSISSLSHKLYSGQL